MKRCKIQIGETLIADNITVADSFVSRLVGLLRHKQLAVNEGMLIIPCSQVHTFGMKFNIDVLFLTQNNQIVAIEQKMTPGKMSKIVKNSHHVLELRAGATSQFGLHIGNQLEIVSI
ncbi:DUF192 domain-containing protein [Dehalobacter sp. DCM]|uniref:DUF192 domain-containing protein n=1 Tax=Dehalobacter sp. DCM TaxID=2907827 RepID=UPI0030819114|nr:DUF192 domain-containing protein [Dehalobacter sp. DCM]